MWDQKLLYDMKGNFSGPMRYNLSLPFYLRYNLTPLEIDYLDESVFERNGTLVSEEILDEWWDRIAEVLDFCEALADAKWEQAYDEQLETYEDLDISVSDCFLEVNLHMLLIYASSGIMRIPKRYLFISLEKPWRNSDIWMA